ncbi:hypothetical protein SIAM614_02661 [Stappia aggregata IAM 12614]|uniref:DUF1778 domain-containing protein n=2 Tax=Roseibium aggregatum TaxID=187304 RepID=A0NUE1_ROSAI|nr:hypothetical protein SIAM614_02661 [Stappia aggregata IAM 12614] [Roseibium aggregatum IAM 12614]
MCVGFDLELCVYLAYIMHELTLRTTQAKEVTMLGATDLASSRQEKSDARLNIRTKASIKAAIEKAAELSGMDLSTFTTNAALLRAQDVIAAHERTVLAPVDHAAFFDALERPAAPTEKLLAAAKLHKEMVAESE